MSPFPTRLGGCALWEMLTQSVLLAGDRKANGMNGRSKDKETSAELEQFCVFWSPETKRSEQYGVYESNKSVGE